MKYREPPKFSRLEFKEETAIRMAKIVKARIEESIRGLFMVTTKEDWFVLVGVMARFLALSYVGAYMDFLTFMYIGTSLHMILFILLIIYVFFFFS